MPCKFATKKGLDCSESFFYLCAGFSLDLGNPCLENANPIAIAPMARAYPATFERASNICAVGFGDRRSRGGASGFWVGHDERPWMLSSTGSIGQTTFLSNARGRQCDVAGIAHCRLVAASFVDFGCVETSIERARERGIFVIWNTRLSLHDLGFLERLRLRNRHEADERKSISVYIVTVL